MPTKEQRYWHENALLITIAGSIIVVIGQLAGTIIPIMFGPEDISDFSLSANPTYIYINQSEEKNAYSYRTAVINIEDFHPYLRPYRYYVYLNVIDKPSGVDWSFLNPEQGKAGETSTLSLLVSNESKIYSDPITIEGIGENGKVRNITIYLSYY